MIEFSSEGWHGVISQEITYESMGIVAQAAGDMLNDEKKQAPPRVVLGYDTRFLSREYAWEIQRVLTGNGIEVYMMRKPVPTSFVSFAATKYQADLGMMVTAGGRPARYSGLVFRDNKGLPVSKQWLSRLFSFLYRRYPRWSEENRALMHYTNILEDYHRELRGYIDFDSIKREKPLVICDSFYGSMGEYLGDILNQEGIRCIKLRGKPNPSFAEALPQPNERNMGLLSKMVLERRGTVGLFFNGDGSQLGVTKDDGEAVDYSLFSSMIFCEWMKRGGENTQVITGLAAPERAVRALHRFGLEFKKLSEVLDWQQEMSSCILWDGFSIRFGPFLPDDDAAFQAMLLLQGLCTRHLDWENWTQEIVEIAGRESVRQKTISVSSIRWEEKKGQILMGAVQNLNGKKLLRTEEEGDLKLWFGDREWMVLSFDAQDQVLKITAAYNSLEMCEQSLRNLIEWMYQ